MFEEKKAGRERPFRAVNKKDLPANGRRESVQRKTVSSRTGMRLPGLELSPSILGHFFHLR
jgi:hypothetical protein